MADNIKVVIKVRPLINREIDDNLQKQWAVFQNKIYPCEQSGRDGIGSFTFDHVFDDTSLTQDVYEKVARPIVVAAVEGMNGTIFAYGQTSSGKTYTMMGDTASPGVIPLAISNIFQSIESKVDRDFLLRVSYIEIYNERIRDLLDVSNVDLKIHEDLNGQVIVKCKEEVTSKASQVLELMRKGDRNRSTGETQMNERSSRSHTIFIIIIESRRHVSPGEEEENSVNVSQLNLVDLAGSERAGQTGETRLRLREGAHINKSLSTLGNVIRQLSDAQGDTNRFISFRDSKLTRILQTSLGGNARTGIICAITPAVLDETYSTLKFAMCAKAIKNKPMVNAVVSDATQIKRLTKEMRNLQEELESKKHLEVDNKRLQEQLEILRDKILMGNSEEVPLERVAALRRRTWCAPQRLPPILEQPQPDFAWEKNKFNPGNNIQRLSNVTGRDDDSTVGIWDSFTSGHDIPVDTPESCRNMAIGDVICLDESNEITNTRCKTPPLCSPNHKCFGIHHTPPCVLRSRAHAAEKELREIGELTTLENMYNQNEMEMIQLIAFLRSQQQEILSQKQDTDKEYEKIQKEIEQLQESLEKTSKDRDEANILQKKSEEEAKSLRCINRDLEFQIENLEIRKQNREKELIDSLKEARKEKERSQTIWRHSSVPQFLNVSQDTSPLVNNDIENVHEISVENDIVALKHILIQKDLDITEKDKCISELRSLLECKTLEKNLKDVANNLNDKSAVLENLQQTIIELENKLQQNEESQRQLNELNETLTKDISESNLQYSTISQLNEELEKNLKDVTNNLNDKSALIENLQQTLIELENKLQQNKKSQRQLNELNETLTKDISESNLQYSTISQLNEELEKNLKDVTNNLNDKSALIENLQQTLIELENKLQQNEESQRQLHPLNETLTKDISESNLQYSTILQLNEELEKNLKDVTNNLNDKSAVLENLQQTIIELENKLQQNEESQRQLHPLNETLTKDISESNLQYSTILQLNEELEKNLKDVTNNLNDKSAVLENLQQTIIELENKLQQNEESQRQLNELNETLTKDISESNLQYSTISQLNEELEKNLKDVTSNLNDKSAVLENLQQTIIELENKLQQNEESQRQLNELNETLTKDISESNLQYSTISQLNEELEKNLKDVTNNLNDKSALIKNLQQTLIELENKLQQNEESQRQLNALNETLTKDISESNLQYSTILQLNEELEKNLKDVTNNLNDKSAVLENLQQTIIELENKLQQNEESQRQLNELNETLTKDISESNLQYSTISQLNEELEKNLKDITNNLNDKSAVLENLQQTIIELENKLQQNEESQRQPNELNETLTKDISESNLQYSTISQLNEELEKNFKDVTNNLNNKSALIENLQQTLIELENKLQQNEESQRQLNELNETLTKDISESNLQYSTISQLNEELEKNLKDVTNNLNDKSALIENLQQTIIELENKLQQNEESQRQLNELNEILTKDISESNLQYSTISQLNEELEKNLKDVTNNLNDKSALIENLQQTLIELENKLQQSENKGTIDVFKHSIHDILSLKSVIQQSLTYVESKTLDIENMYHDKSANVIKSKLEDVDMEPAQNKSRTYSSIRDSRQITIDLDKLDKFISVFETNMFETSSLLEVHENDFPDFDKCCHNLETKLSKIINMHRFFIEKLKNLIMLKNVDYNKLLNQNILLKSNVEQCENEVRELVKDTEKLEKRVLHQRSETEVGSAEHSLLNSQYTTVLHHHSNLHSSCISTVSYLREKLKYLQLTLLQTDKVNDENDLSFEFSTPKKCPPSHTVSNLDIPDESIRTPVNLISEISPFIADHVLYENLKLECENLHSDLSTKCSEIKQLSEQLADHNSLKQRYSQLQIEHEVLSTELMDSLQETDETKKLYNSLKVQLETMKYNDNSTTTVNISHKVNMLDTSIQTSSYEINFDSRETNTNLGVKNVHETIENECKEFIKKHIYSMNEIVPDVQCTLLEWLKLYITIMEKRLPFLSRELTLIEDRHLPSDVIAKQNLFNDYQNKVLSLQDELESKSSEISILQLEVLKQKEDLRNSLKMVQDLQDTNNLLKIETEYQKKSSEVLVKTHETEKYALLTEINKLETKEKGIIIEYSKKEIGFTNIIGSLKNELHDRVSEISQLQNEVKNMDNILNSLNEKYDNLYKTMSDVNSDSNKKTIELSDLQLKISNTLEEKLKLNAEIDNSLQTIEQLKKELLTKSNQLTAMQKDNDVLTDIKKILSQSLDDINNNYAHMQLKLQDQEKVLKEKLNLNDVISELQSQIIINKEEKSKLSNDIKMLENEIQTSKLHIKQSNEELKTSADQIKELSQHNIILKQSEEALSKTMEDAIKNLRNESETTIKQLKDNIIILNEQLKCKQNALDDQEVKFSELNKSFVEMENLLEIISDKYEDDKKKHVLQLSTLGDELLKLTSDKILIEEERLSLLSNNDQLSHMLNEKDLEIETKVDKIKKLEVTTTSLQFENQRIQTELQNQIKFVESLQSKIKSLLEKRREEAYSVQRLQELEAEHSRLSSANHILENRVADLQTELSALLRSSPKMRHDLHLRRQSLHDLQRNLMQRSDNPKTSAEDNDVSMEDCGTSRENSELKEKVKQLDLQLKTVQDKNRQLEQALSNKAQDYQKIIIAFNSVEAKLKEMHKLNATCKPKQDASTYTNPDDKAALMSLFVDKMTHDFLNEKYKNLQKANEDYRMKNKEQAVELRRLQHSLQNNALHSLLPRDESKNIIELRTKLTTLEQEKTDWENKYREMDVEYDACVELLKERTSDLNSLFSEKLLLEVEMQNLKTELENTKRGSPGREARRKRQSIYDANRGTSFTTADASTNTVLDPSQSMCANCESIRRSLDEVKIQNAELQTRLSLQPAMVPVVFSPTPGSGIVQTQKLHEYMKENQMLKIKLIKYKDYAKKMQQKLAQDYQNKN